MKCERVVVVVSPTGKTKVACKATATLFVCGDHVCALHAPKGNPSCSHSLSMNGRCSFCGAEVAAC